MRAIAKVHKHVTNPVVRIVAPHSRYMAVIEHRGRKSGNGYQTPVMAFVDGGQISVVLNYGAGSDWVRNVTAAGTATVVNRRTRYRLTEPRVLPVDSPALPSAIRSATTPPRTAFQGTLESA
jgi:deazaflavin-dependent oxidoreductase (nitroreductase family)